MHQAPASGRSRPLVLAAFAAAAMLLAPADPAQAQCIAVGNTTTCTSETRSATTIVVVAGGGPLASQLEQVLAGPNGAAIGNALSQALGPGSFSQTANTSITGYATIGPAPAFPIGPGPGTINCTGLPSGTTWPVPNCDFTGYQTFVVAAGNFHVQLNTHTAFDTSVNIAAGSAALNVLLGDLHTTFHTTLIDQGFQFITMLLSRGSESGVINGSGPGGLFSPTPLGFAPDAMGAHAFDFDGTMAFAVKAPRTPMTAALGNGWRAWIRGTAGLARFEGTDANFGFRYRTASGEGGVERVMGPWMVGAAFGYSAARVDQDTTRDFGHLDTLRTGVYASYRPGPWWITAAVAVGFSNIDATRLAALPTPARSEYDATTVSAGIEAVRRIATAHAVYEPVAGLVYTGLRVDSFTETGTTFLDLSGDRASIDALKGYVGGRMYKVWVAPNGISWSPEFRTRLLYDFLDDPRGYTARFVLDPTIPLPVTGLQPDRFATMVGVAATVRLNGWRAFGSYDAEIRGGDVAHLVSAGVKGSW